MKLRDSVENFFKLDEKKKEGLKKLKIFTLEDLLRHFPFRYELVKDLSNEEFRKGDNISFRGKVLKIENKKTIRRIYLIDALIENEMGLTRASWFNQPYIVKMLSVGDTAIFTGKVSQNKKGEFYLMNPVFKKENPDFETSLEFGNLPVYPETKGITSKWLHFAITRILNGIDEKELDDFIPKEILSLYHLPNLKNSFIYIHNPQNPKNSEAARKRFAFEEIFLIQLNRLKSRLERDTKSSYEIEIGNDLLKNFIDSFDFSLTGAQKKAIFSISRDFKKGDPMSRLLHGDVGSGKTVVALAAAFMAYENGLQIAYMAPTEILARQHFETFINFADFFSQPVKIGLLTSSYCEKFPSKINPKKSTSVSKARMQKWVRDGDIKILIGTHAIIQEKVFFKKLGFVIIDEQHRFGVSQRFRLAKKESERVPHLLSMTATPIPRTLALTIFGDLDLTLLDEMPAGRKQVVTYIVPPSDRARAYEQIREELKKGRQAYIVCPRIELKEESEENEGVKIEMKAVKKEYEYLTKEIFKEWNIEMLHGKLLPKEKEKIMKKFKDKETDILVSTSVIEVGIDVPNANCILIEGADRFGLAQLHQLRGRVFRSSNQAYCFVLSESNSLKVLKRLSALAKAKNGFELAEYDLNFRGAGELSGGKQWGVSDIGMEGLKNLKMVEAARAAAKDLLKSDPELSKNPILKEKIEKYNSVMHWE